MEKGWGGLPYNTIAEHYQSVFGEKVYKIPVSIVDDCPNRRGLKGMQTCIFCDAWGSAAHSESLQMDLKKQIETYQAAITKRYKAKKFLVYFQAYTNTFTKLSLLRQSFDAALSSPQVVGIVIGTRPDCLSLSVLRLWKEYSEKTYVAVEFGVQSFFNDQLEFLRRGHTAEQSIEAIHKVAELKTITLGAHLILGQPQETAEHILRTAEILNTLPLHNIKLHHLHVLKNTPLEILYQQGQFTPIDLETYASRLQMLLENISPHFYLHRLAAYAPRWEELVAPEWTANKMGTHQFIIDFLRTQKSFQSKNYSCTSAEETRLKAGLKQKSLPRNFHNLLQNSPAAM